MPHVVLAHLGAPLLSHVVLTQVYVDRAQFWASFPSHVVPTHLPRRSCPNLVSLSVARRSDPSVLARSPPRRYCPFPVPVSVARRSSPVSVSPACLSLGVG